jgi:(S)-sulfolactate dehydrogenase
MADIVIAEFMDEAALADVPEHYEVLYDPGLVDDPDRLLEVAGDARALIVRNRTQVRGGLLEAMGKLECIGRLGVGLDNIDVADCAARGIDVFPATGANDVSVAEYVMTAALMLRRKAYACSERVAAGEWPRQAMIGREVSGAVMGLVGLGAIARQVALRAEAFGMTVIAHDPYVAADDAVWDRVGRRSLDALLAEADVVSLHVPLSAETRHLISAAELARMKPGAVLINAARGGVVDETAVLAALSDGRLGGLALDVFEDEPMGAEAGRKFAGLDNVILTPHIAGVTEEPNRRISFATIARVVNRLKENDG